MDTTETSENQTPKLSELLSSRLSSIANDLVHEWVDWVRSRVDNPTVDALPHRALLNHIPPVVLALTRYMRSPTYAMREEMMGHLRIHGQIRRDQGYAATDLMAEFDGLSHMIFRAMQTEVERLDAEYPVSEVLDTFSRLSDGLRAMSYVTLAVYQQAAERRRQELARRLADFGRSIGHELKNPLNTISISAQALRGMDGIDASLFEAQLEAIERAVSRASGLIDNIDILSMAQSGEARARMAALPRIVEDARCELTSQALARGIDFKIPSEIPRVAVEGLVGTLALVNVLSNAIKYYDPSKETPWVKLTARVIEGPETPCVELVVEDNGIGIPPDLQPRVFQRAFRAHPDKAEGTGLGLAIVQELLVERGGQIELDSTENEGTTVRIRLHAIDVGSVESDLSAESPDSLMEGSVRMVLDEEDSDDEAAP